MEQLELNVEERSVLGSAQARRMRKEGMVPAVVYSDGTSAQSLMISAHEFMMAARGKKRGQVFKFKSRNNGLDGSLVLVKDVQIEPLKSRVLHVDFLAVHEGQQIHVKVPMVLSGEPAAVKEGRGMLIQSAYEIEVTCALTAIPEQIILDISGLEEGDALHANEIALPAGAFLYSNMEAVIVSVIAADQSKEEEADKPAAEAAATPAAAKPAAGKAAPKPAGKSGDK